MDDIAVIGMSCKFPGAENVEEYWDLIVNGRDAISKVPEGRWHPIQPEYAETCGGFLKSAVDEFDAKFFGISPRETQFIDPQQRMLLELSWAALEDAGINPLDLHGSRTGVFVGMWRCDYEKLYRGLAGINDLRDYMGNSHATASGRISYFLGLTGNNVTTDAGCSSSMMSVHLACQCLKSEESSLAIAGGINLLIGPFNEMTMTPLLAVDGRCKTFDEKADGFGRAEGCGILILKKLSNAIRDGDGVLAVIRGSGVSQEGTSSSFGTPSKESQVLSLQRAFNSCNIKPLDVDYVEAHGTGTLKGDPVEISAIGEVYSEGRKNPLIIGSVKTNIGHTESAAGVAGIIKVILAMNKGIIPPHRNLEKLNPSIDIESTPCIIPNSPIIWDTVIGKPRIAGVSSFGISGTNVHMLLQESNQLKKEKKQSELTRTSHLLTLSATSTEALKQMVVDYSDFMSLNGQLNLADVCFSANTGRAHFPHRIAVHDSTITGMANKLQNHQYKQSSGVATKGKVAFLFPGQGTQYGQMGKELYDTHPVFRDSLNYVCNIFQEMADRPLLPIIFGEPESPDLHESLYSQISIFCIEYSLLQLWTSFGIQPDLVIGHSLGEFAAAFAAGVLSIEHVSLLLYTRTRLISNLQEGGMIAVKCGLAKFETLLKEFIANADNGWLDVACVNSPDQIVISAKKNTISKLEIVCRELGVKTVVLASHHAYHSRDMDLILSEYEKVAETLDYQSMKCQYISGVSGRLLEHSEMNSHYWVDQCRNSVYFENAMTTAISENCTVFIEIGPQPVLLGLGMQNVSAENIQWLPSIKKKENNWTTIFDSLSQYYVAGQSVNWQGFDGAYSREKVRLPTYPFQREKHWFDLKPKRSALIGSRGCLHPLVGKKHQSSISDKTFQNIFSLEQLKYLADHNVAHKAILPTSGMLEMFIVAGQLMLQNNEQSLDPLTSLVIEDLVISCSFEIDEDVECLSEIVVTPTSSNNFDGFSVKLFRGIFDEQDNITWEQCAAAKFMPSQLKVDTQLGALDLEKIRSGCIIATADEIYSSLWNIGLTFGKAFQSVKNIWKNEKEILAQIDLENSDKSLVDYLGHPVLIDGMIQLSVFGLKSNGTGLHLPIGVKKYTWIARSRSATTYAHAKFEEDGRIQNIALYDDKWQLLALIEGIILIKTTIKSFLTSLRSNSSVQLPGLYEEVFQKKSGAYTDRINLEQILCKGFSAHGMTHFMKSIDKLTEESVPLEQSLAKLGYLYIAKAFTQLGWNNLKMGDTLDHIQVTEFFGVQPRHKGFIFRCLQILAEEKFLVLKSAKNIHIPSEWQIANPLPTIDIIDSNIEKEKLKITQYKDFGWADGLDLVSICGEKLPSTLQGKENISKFLFPSDKNKFSAENLYTDVVQHKNANSTIVKYFECGLECLKNNIASLKNGKIRILEIGAGTGGTSSCVLPVLESTGISYTYTYTDISATLLDSAKERFKEFSKNKTYRLLNIENDPMLQGFAPEQFDIILAANVLHATTDLKETTLNCRRLLTGGGSLILYETLIPDRNVDIIFGVLEGHYRFSDLGLRPFHAVIDGPTWCNLFEDNGFDETIRYDTALGKGVVVARANHSFFSQPIESESETKTAWIVITNTNALTNSLELNLSYIKRKTYAITTNNLASNFTNLIKDLLKEQKVIEGIIYLGHECVDKNGYLEGMDGVLKMAQFILTQKFAMTTKFMIISQGAVLVGNHNCALPNNALYLGFFNSLKNENPEIKVTCVDLDPNEKDVNILSKQIIQEAFSTDGIIEIQIAIRNNSRLVVRLKNLEEGLPKLALPRSPRFSICLPESRSFADLKYCADQKRILAANEIEVAIRATGLNFKDVMIILKPDGLFSHINAIGLEFSGIVANLGSKVSDFKKGDSVFGLAGGANAISSHIAVNKDLITIKPDSITHYEASALPAVFATCIYSLEMLANITSADTVLIHAATGGVGISAIQICNIKGAKIVATAGNPRKRAYLRSLGIEYVYDSRNISYGEEIKKATGGVDVVLNSLTGTNYKETTLSVCNKNARFIEIGAANIWKHEDVRKLRPDVNYHIVDLGKVSSESIGRILSTISNNITKGIYTPLPIVHFDGRQIRDAFEYFQKTQHIGKIVLSTPTTIDIDRNLSHKCMLFSEDGTYLITGGLGGLGLEVTKFMAEYGAKNIVLVGRSHPNDFATKTIFSLRKKSFNVLTFQVDIGSFSECEKLLDSIKELGLPPLKGIMHAATGFFEAMIPNQNIDMFKTVYTSKVDGAWNLHNLTLNYNLEHFVLFSSVTSILSPLGLAGYSSANAYLDALADYRYSLGLPVTSINWGPWSEVGIAADKVMGIEGLFGILPFTPAHGILALKHVLRKNLLRVAVVNIETNAYLEAFPRRQLYIENIKDFSESGDYKKNVTLIDTETFYKEIKPLASEIDKLQDYVKIQISNVVKQVLKLNESDTIDENKNFVDLGMDSLMTIEMKNKVKSMLGNQVSLAEVNGEEFLTLNALTHTIVSKIPNAINDVQQS